MKQWANNLVRYLKLYREFIRLSLMSIFVYRINTLVMSLTPIVWMATVVVFLSVILGKGANIGGWSYWEMLTLLGIHEIIFLGCWFLFIGNLERFIEEIGSGKFDRILLRPANHRFLISFNWVDINTLIGIFNAVLVIFLSLSRQALVFNLWRLILFFTSFVSAFVVFYFLYFSIASLSLFFVKAENFTDWFQEATDFNRYPAEIYGNYFKFFLFFGLPILFFAYVPTAILLNKLPGYFAFLSLIMAVWFYCVSTLLWRLGLRKYQSASS